MIAIAINNQNKVVGMRRWGDNDAEDAAFERWALTEGYGFLLRRYKSFLEAERDGWEWVETTSQPPKRTGGVASRAYGEECDCDPVMQSASDVELERLRQWKREALVVLAEWEKVWEAAGRPGALGESNATATLNYVERYVRSLS